MISPVLAGESLPADSPSVGSAGESSPPPPPSPAAPAPPPHPASTQVDFPPAAPGYPPLHASQPAEDGCWWAPFLSEKYQLEMLIKRCGPNGQSAGSEETIVEDATGIGARDPNSKELLHAFDVLTKPAAQPIATAIRMNFIAKDKSPAVRQGCVPVRSKDDRGPVESYEIQPTAAYARQPRFNKGDDSPDPCPGLATDDAVGRGFYYVPTDSKTKYLYYASEEAWPIDFQSFRFLPEAGAAQVQSTAAAGAPSPAAGAKDDSGSANETAHRGVWTHAPRMNVNDLSDDAATSGILEFLMGGAPQPVIFYLGCNGKAPGGPTVELRAAFPIGPGYDTSVGPAATLLLPDGKKDITLRSTTSGRTAILITPLGVPELTKFAFEEEAEDKALAILFMPGIQRATVTADMPPDNENVERVVRACRVNLPPRPPKPVAALAPDQVSRFALAKIALGMTADQVKEALGSDFRYQQQADQKFPNMVYLGAWSHDSAYEATLIDGSVAGFSYAHTFPPGAQPLQSNLIDGITAKAWSPIFNRPPYRVIWVTDAQGNPKLKARADVTIHPCAGMNDPGFGPAPAGVSGDGPAKLLKRVLPRDNGPDCGVTITLWMNPSRANNGTADQLEVSAANDMVFHDFMLKANAASRQQQQQQHDQLNKIQNPY